MVLKAVLYENQGIYIASNVGRQSQLTFKKIEEIALRIGQTANSIDSLKNIIEYEVVTSPACKTGFTHAQTGYTVKFWNGSQITTLNGQNDSNRGARATLVYFEESGFSTDDLILSTEAFATQDMNFKTSTDKDFNINAQRKKQPTQLIYASSASNVDTIFYRKYREFSSKMLSGDKRFFVCDMPCDVALQPTMDGKPYNPLLTQLKVDTAMRANREKAMREYYNKFTTDGGVDQIIKWAQIRRNETFILPQMANEGGEQFAVAFDPARTNDNSIIGVMKIIRDENIGYYGEIVNVTNLVDLASKRGYKLTSPKQSEILKQTILDYNGETVDYENISKLIIDAGAGGGGTNAYADYLLMNWFDKKGNPHKGFIDVTHPAYSDLKREYPTASNKLSLKDPKKWRTTMIEDLIEMMKHDLIKFPKEYDGKGYVTLTKKQGNEEVLYNKSLSLEEEVSLINIDAMKTEATSIHRFTNPENTSVSYKLPKDKERKMHDDRFYVLAMLAHHLAKLRRADKIRPDRKKDTLADYFNFGWKK